MRVPRRATVALPVLMGALLCAPAGAAFDDDDVERTGITSPGTAPPPLDTTAAKTRQRLLILELEAAGVHRAPSRWSTDWSPRAWPGCDTTSCLAELAGAMGTRFVVFGTVGRLGDVTLVQMSLFDSEAAKPIAREEVRASDDNALLDDVPAAARRLVTSVVAPDDPLLGPAPERRGVAVGPEDETSLGVLPLTLMIGGGAVAAGSTLIGGAAVLTFVIASTQLVSDVPSASLKNGLYRPLGVAGAVVSGLSMVGFGVGAAIGTAGFLWSDQHASPRLSRPGRPLAPSEPRRL